MSYNNATSLFSERLFDQAADLDKQFYKFHVISWCSIRIIPTFKGSYSGIKLF